MEFPWDHDGKLKKGIGGNDEELLKSWPGLTFDNTRDYILLGFASHASRLPDELMSMDGPSLHDLLLDRTSAWHPNLRKLFSMSDASTSFPINIRTSERIAPWESTNVTLIGDAIHTMTPGLGVGANTALLDAKILAEQLVRSETDDDGIVSAVASYEGEMHSYAWNRVEKSLERFNADDAVYKPGLTGTVATMLLRGGMRLVNSVPPLKRRFAAEMTKERGDTS